MPRFSGHTHQDCACNKNCTPFYEAGFVKDHVVERQSTFYPSCRRTAYLLTGSFDFYEDAHSTESGSRSQGRSTGYPHVSSTTCPAWPNVFLLRCNPLAMLFFHAAAVNGGGDHARPSRNIAQAVTRSFRATATTAIFRRLLLPRHTC